MQIVALRAQITELTVPEAVLYALLGMCVVMAVLALLMFLVRLLSAGITGLEKKAAAKKSAAKLAAAMPQTAAADIPAAPHVPEVTLINTDEATAAVIMAIVAEQSGIPPEHLAFKTIRLMEEPQ